MIATIPLDHFINKFENLRTVQLMCFEDPISSKFNNTEINDMIKYLKELKRRREEDEI